MPYFTQRERQAAIIAFAIGATIIILTLCAAASVGALSCPPDVFC